MENLLESEIEYVWRDEYTNPSNIGFWIGGRSEDQSDLWTWVDQIPIPIPAKNDPGFDNWFQIAQYHYSEPNVYRKKDQCVFMSIKDKLMSFESFGKWFDDSCHENKYFVCEQQKITMQSSFL